MGTSPPLLYRWEGDCWRPIGRFAKEADRHFTIGETRKLAEVEDRSGPSHRHYFAELREAFLNLPEHLAERFVNEDDLRKFALCKAGFCDTKRIACASNADALNLFRTLGPDYDYATIEGKAVTFFTAHSQSYRAADKATFKAQKDAVIGVLEDLIGVGPGELARNAREAA